MTEPDLRRALVQTTVELLRDEPPTAISLRAVARRLGVSSGAPYHHFPDKTALFAEVALEGWVSLGCALDASTGPPVARLRAMGRAYLDFALAHPEHYRVMFLPELKDPERFAALHLASSRNLEALVALVAGIRGCACDDADVLTRVIGGWSTLHGFARLHAAGVLDGKVDHLDARALVDGVADAATRAILSP